MALKTLITFLISRGPVSAIAGAWAFIPNLRTAAASSCTGLETLRAAMAETVKIATPRSPRRIINLGQAGSPQLRVWSVKTSQLLSANRTASAYVAADLLGPSAAAGGNGVGSSRLNDRAACWVPAKNS